MKHSDQNLCRTILNRITIQQKINLLQKQEIKGNTGQPELKCCNMYS